MTDETLMQTAERLPSLLLAARKIDPQAELAGTDAMIAVPQIAGRTETLGISRGTGQSTAQRPAADVGDGSQARPDTGGSRGDDRQASGRRVAAGADGDLGGIPRNHSHHDTMLHSPDDDSTAREHAVTRRFRRAAQAGSL